MAHTQSIVALTGHLHVGVVVIVGRGSRRPGVVIGHGCVSVFAAKNEKSGKRGGRAIRAKKIDGT